MPDSLLPSPTPLEPVPEDHVRAFLATVLGHAQGGTITRESATFLASVGADLLADRLHAAGWVVARRAAGLPPPR